MRTLRFLKFAGFAILGLGFIILAIFLTMSLWNALIPELFKGPMLTFWQTAGLFLLSKILLTGVAPGSRYHGRHDWRRKYHKGYMHGCREYENTPQTAAQD
jgi:hypothetical protein